MEESNIMTTKEVAQYIKVNEKTVLKLAQYGELPGVKVGNQWRFHLVAIDHYLQKQFFESSDEDLDLVIQTKDHPIPLSRLTDSALIDLDFKADNKKQALSKLAKIAYLARATSSYESLYLELEGREKMLSTAVGEGIALPHARFPHRSLFKEPKIVIAKSNVGIEFDAPDKKKVKLFFMSCAPTEYTHVRILAKISKLLHMPDVIERLKEASKKEDVMQILMAFDQAHILPDSSVENMRKVINDQVKEQGKRI